MRLSLFLIATAVLAAVNVSAVPAQPMDENSAKGNLIVPKKGSALGVDMKKTISGTIPQAAGIKASGEKAAGVKAAGEKAAGVKAAGVKAAGEKAAGVKAAGVKAAGVKAAGEKAAGVKAAGVKAAGVKAADVPQVSEKVQAANGKLANDMNISLGYLDGIISDINEYLSDNEATAKKFELANILMNDSQPNPFSVLLFLINLVSQLEESIKKSVLEPLSGSPPFKFGFTAPELAPFSAETMKIVDEAQKLLDEFLDALAGKPTTTKFSTISFLEPSEVQEAINDDAYNNIPRIEIDCLPNVDWLNSWVEKLAYEAQIILKNVDTAISAITEANQPNPGQPNAGQPNTEQPNAGQPNTEQPNAGQPNTEQPNTEQPNTEQPNAGQPNTEQPNAGQPNAGQPNTGQPNTSQPNAGQPTGQPNAGISNSDLDVLDAFDDIAPAEPTKIAKRALPDDSQPTPTPPSKKAIETPSKKDKKKARKGSKKAKKPNKANEADRVASLDNGSAAYFTEFDDRMLNAVPTGAY